MKSHGQWERILEETDELYSPRWGHSVNIIDDSAFIFGGFDGMYKDDLWKINLKQFDMTQVKSKVSPAIQGLLQRSLHSSIVYKSSLIIYGGMINIGSHVNLYQPLRYNTLSNKWSVIHTENPFKINRVHHTASLVHDDFMFVFGGEEVFNPSNHSVSLPTLLLNLQTMKWSKLLIENNNKCSTRNFHSAWVNATGDKVYVFGGYATNYDCLNDMLILHFDDVNALKSNRDSITISVTVVNFEGFAKYPFPRWGASVNYLESEEIIVFGGRNKVDFNDLWLFDIKQSRWFQLVSFSETPIPRRKHISFVYKNIFAISGGYNGTFLNDFNVLSLSSISNYHSKEKEIIQYINNPLNSDLILVNSSTEFNCHKMLFFSHLPEEDIIASHIIKYLSTPRTNLSSSSSSLTEKKCFDITQAHCSNTSVMKFIELLYLGHFSSYITGKELNSIITLMLFFHLTKAIQVLFQKIIVNNVLFDFSNTLHMNMIELIAKNLPSNQILNISYDESTVLLRRNSIPFNSKAYKHLNCLIYYRFSQSMTRKEIAALIKYYIINHTLPLFSTKVEEICFLVEALFYADFFCYESFYNQLERAIIVLITCNSTLSRRFLLIVAVCAYFTNSRILYVFLIEKVLKDYSIPLKKLICLLFWLMKDKEDYDEMRESAVRFYKENKHYLYIVRKQLISDFALIYHKPAFTERNDARTMLDKLTSAMIHFKVPKLNLLWKRPTSFNTKPKGVNKKYIKADFIVNNN